MATIGHTRNSRVASKPTAPAHGFRLGSVFGVELVVDVSLIVVFVLITTNLGLGAFPRWHPEWSPLLALSLATVAALAFFASVAAHELAHALVGRAYGIPVRRITLFVFGGMAHVEDEPPNPRSEFFMAIVGPVVSLVIGVLSGLLAGVLAYDVFAQHAGEPSEVMRQVGPGVTLLLWLGPLNIALGFFNLVPGFPLDGGRVLRATLWWLTGNLRLATRWASLLGQTFGWFLMLSGAALVFGLSLPGLGGGFLQGLWLALIGWFLNNAARASYEQLIVREALSHVPIRDVMRSRVVVAPPEITIAELVRDYALTTDQQAFPVVRGDILVGLVQASDVRRVPRERWHTLLVGDIMTPVSELSTIGPDDDAMEVLPELPEHEPIPVVEDRHLLGVARRDDILRWLSFRTASTRT